MQPRGHIVWGLTLSLLDAILTRLLSGEFAI
jgi:hypothetical protein